MMVIASIDICKQIGPEDFITERIPRVFDTKDSIESILRWAAGHGVYSLSQVSLSMTEDDVCMNISINTNSINFDS